MEHHEGETFQVGLAVDQRLPDEFGGLEFPRRLMYGIHAPPNVVAKVVALFNRFGHAADTNF